MEGDRRVEEYNRKALNLTSHRLSSVIPGTAFLFPREHYLVAVIDIFLFIFGERV
jgi:hypothetical protein